MFNKILVPYNGTVGSQKSFEKAVFLASSIQAKIIILTCIEKRPTFSLFKTKAKNEEFEKEKKIIEKQHDEMKSFAKKSKVVCESKIVQGDNAADEILLYADKHKIDLIIMSKTKFSSHKERMHYQSTLENVARNISCDILILN